MTGKWWQGCVFYQINTRSFADSNGDSIGDMQGHVGGNAGIELWFGGAVSQTHLLQ